ncbi:hypothetical protein RE474_08800 [Methanolobus sediminis]|uniref:S-layer family duplication domain-containing protein n=1 Tax=Methanolobus sediminis TaxID=3072978 RepID=A0AA51YKQ6_9EURY|nr:hypothetical protein [Methanolobus sediminis]WMW24194.1 hypothetical protein RE474_08800 [Methanolobus sediminis]
MKYIHFVIISVCILLLCVSPASGVRTKTMIHYSEPQVTVQDEIFLEQGYSFKVLDMNSKSGDIWIELYLDGEEVELDDNFAKKDEPLEYIRSVVEDEDDDEEEEVDYFILRITPEGDVDEDDGVVYSTIYVEQYMDPVEDMENYLLLDKSYSLTMDSELELSGLYTLEATDVDDDEVTLELRIDGKLLKEDEVEADDYFYYTVYSDGNPETLFLANVKAFFESGDEVSVFINHVSLKQSQVSSSDELPDGLDIDVSSPVDGGLKAGRIAIVSYSLNESFSEVRILVDGKVLDSRYNVSPGVYKAVSGEMDAGIHKATLRTINEDDESSYYSEDFSVSVNIKDNITESIVEIANTAAAEISKTYYMTSNTSKSDDSTKDSSSDAGESSESQESGLSPALWTSSTGVSNAVSLIITAGVFLLFFTFFNKFR